MPLGSQTAFGKVISPFTGHELLESVGLIHMNGRVYDPEIGRFLSADPFLSVTVNLQKLNRYTYVMNNPLSYTDPTGYFSLKKFVKKFVKKIFKNKIVQTIAQVAASVVGVIYNQPWLPAATSAAFTKINGGSWGDAAKAAAISFVTAKAFNTAGTMFKDDLIARGFSHGIIGGLRSSVSGGDFQAGFAGGVAGFAGTDIFNGDFIATIVSGGIGAELGGGKFRNGAITATYGYVHNFLAHTILVGLVVYEGYSIYPSRQSTVGSRNQLKS